MNLILNYQTSAGVAANYWTMARMEIIPNRTVVIYMALYLSQDAFSNGLTPLMTTTYSYNEPADITQSPGDYALAKMQAESFFQGATVPSPVPALTS